MGWDGGDCSSVHASSACASTSTSSTSACLTPVLLLPLPPSPQYLLNVRRMVLNEPEDLDTWLDFATLCRYDALISV